MGRPIQKKFFGNINSPYQNQGVGGTSGVGGEGVSTIVRNNTGTNYSTSTTISLTFTAPQIPGGSAATGRVTTNAFGNVAAVTLLTSGSGYTSTPSATVNGGTTGTTATFVVTLTSTRQNAIAGNAFITGGSAQAFDIVKQEASKRYLVKTANGLGQCRLITTSTLAAKQMTIIATDVNGSTYFVEKLTARRAVLIKYINAAGGFEYGQRATPKWSLSAATTGTVSIANN